jgi:dephospho-CoA kinase
LGKGQEKIMKLKSEWIKLSSPHRLYQYERPIIALTGGIATGKSTVTRMLQDQGIQVIDADQLVKSIYETQEAKNFIANNYPECILNNEINFKKLRELVFSQEMIKTNIESFIYQRLPEAFAKVASTIQGQEFYIYDVPLLFERKLNHLVDQIVVVYAPQKIQLARIMDRDGSKEETARQILKQQMDIEEKKEKADFVINNISSMAELSAEVSELLRKLIIP